ncbi:uncharacterized protein [Triticum aestivum]|uniref:uncharacterized protein isoform X1 n=1 Tax=Triticum aestivum TaxID=4565 RepID=UPI001D016AFB|nr:uncharacterized protein LOC123141815 isoform X1 [Triticum aestivum]
MRTTTRASMVDSSMAPRSNTELKHVLLDDMRELWTSCPLSQIYRRTYSAVLMLHSAAAPAVASSCFRFTEYMVAKVEEEYVDPELEQAILPPPANKIPGPAGRSKAGSACKRAC